MQRAKGKNPGQSMCFIDVSDPSCQISIVVFPDVYKNHKDLIYEDNTVLIRVEHTKNKSLCAQKIIEIS